MCSVMPDWVDERAEEVRRQVGVELAYPRARKRQVVRR